MSLAVLKKKAQTKYSKNMAVGHDGFSLQGKLRNFGAPGKTNLARSVTRTPFHGIVPIGNGGNLGNYEVRVVSSGNCCIKQTLVKPSVVSTKGMLARKLLCCRPIVKSENPRSQSDQTTHVMQEELCANNCNYYAKNHRTCYDDPEKPSFKCKGKYTKNLPLNISTGEYVKTTLITEKVCEYKKSSDTKCI